MDDLEHIYDSEVAPRMAEIIEICQAHGLPMHATFQYGEGGFVTTHVPAEGEVWWLDLLRVVAMSHGNVDLLFMAISQHAKKHGHSSLFLHAAGLPTHSEGEGEPA